MPIYLKLVGLPGTARGKYKGWHLLQAYNFGGPLSAGSKQIHVLRDPDQASNSLRRASASGAFVSGMVERTVVDSRTKLETAVFQAKFSNALIVSHFNGNEKMEAWTLDCHTLELKVTAEPGGN